MPTSLKAVFLAALLLPAMAAGADWAVARTGRFEVYAQDGEAPARAALLWFEQLRATVRQETGLDVSGRGAVRVIGFHSETEYSRYRMTPTADAYCVGTGERDTIVMPSLGDGSFPMAAHEFAHLIQHAAASRLPPWMSEGLADVFSTVRIDKRGSRIGGEVPGRLDTLRRNAWMPLAQLMALPANSPLRDRRAASELFYAESWALAEMLALSPAYRPRFGVLLAALAEDTDSAAAVQRIYGKPLDAVRRDLAAWVGGRRSKPTPLARPEPDTGAVTIATAPAGAVQLIMAELLLSAGDWSGAESAYRELARETPEIAGVWAGLGAVAAARQQFDEARTLWKRALDQGLSDAGICFRYAELLDREGGLQDERRAALERAVALQSEFDDARWILALLEENAGRYQAALAQLQAMREIAPSRAYYYWCTVADALTGLGRSDEAQAAAGRAAQQAATAEERAKAAQLAYIARTRLAVRLTRDAAGNPQMVTTRVPNDAVEFNPFIEPDDDLRRVQGTLREIECASPALRLSVDTAGGRLALTIPDPARVQMRNGPQEFVCGPQPGNAVLVEYAATKEKEGIVRGVEFR
jgi:tetratricopeptide (TPR) repeat protein